MSVIDIAATTSPHDWKYLSEGAATIVLTYVGPPILHLNDQVLRIRKNGGAATNGELDSVRFQTEIIPRLVPRDNLPTVQLVSLSSSWLENLSTLCAESRPLHRTDNIDLSRTHGLLVRNLVSSPMSIEIKPKWSFLRPESRTCRYCMNSCCRGWTTNYCPLDLFSTSPARVRNALYALYDFWVAGPPDQNNLRIFVGGDVVPPGNLLSALRSNPMLSSTISEEELRNLFVETLYITFTQPESACTLKTLNRLQRTLDGIGIEGLGLLWDKVHHHLSLGEGYTQPMINDWHSFVSKYLNRQRCIDTELGSWDEDNPEELYYHILSSLLSGTFKDCSMIIMLPGFLSAADSQSPAVSLKLIDLDQKPIHRLGKWLKQNRTIAQEYAALVNEKVVEMKVCVDDRVV